MLIEWIKPSGVEVKTHDRKATIEYCKSLGWKEKGAKEEKETSKVSKKKTAKKTDK